MKSLLALALIASGCASNARTTPPPTDARAAEPAAPEPTCEGRLQFAESAWRAYAIEMKHERLDVLVRGARAYADAADVWATQLRLDHDPRRNRATREAERAAEAASRSEMERGRRGQRTDPTTDSFIDYLIDAREHSIDAAAAARSGELGQVLRERVLEADQAEERSLIAEAWVETSGMAANSIALRGEPYVYGPSSAIATETFTAANEASLAVMRSCPAPQLRSDEPDDESRRPVHWKVI
jgi:hypothetical protein